MTSRYIAAVRAPLPASYRRGRSASSTFAGLRRWLYRVVPRRRRQPLALRVRGG